jgi:hypothetical protein
LRQDLLSKLPVRQGETLTDDSVKNLRETVRQFDEHLTVNFASSDSQEVVIRITAPGSLDKVFFFNKPPEKN